MRFAPSLATITLALSSLALSNPASATPLPVVMDGTFGDWSGVAPIYSDGAGDGGAFDFGRLYAADDARFLFLRLEVGNEGSLDENNSLIVYLDTDNNASTGLAISGIGAELEWKLGQRTGTYYRGGSTWSVYQDDLRFRAFPTVTASEFELCFGRDTLPNGSQPLFFGSTVRILFRDTAAGGDQLPNVSQTVSYTMDQGAAPGTDVIPFARAQSTDLRIVTQNSHNDGLYDGGLQPKFRRLYSAVAGDIYNLEEIYNHTPAQTQALFQSWFPSSTWYSADVNDCQTISKYPIEGTWSIDGNLACLINTTAVTGAKLLIVNAHLPCCTDDSGRQQEVDHILQFLRDATREPGGLLDIPANTGILLTGDMNFVGFAQQVSSFVNGDIVNNGTYGADFPPDWDGTSLVDLISRQSEKRMSYTWRSDTSSFWPGRLDFGFFTDSVLDAGNHFLVYTHEMSSGSLASYGLQAADSDASDHLVQVRDFRAHASSTVPSLDHSGPALFLSPNPTKGEAMLRFEAGVNGQVELQLFDALGRRVPGWSRELDVSPGPVEVPLDLGDDLASGFYWIKLSGLRGRARGVTSLVLLPRR